MILSMRDKDGNISSELAADCAILSRSDGSITLVSQDGDLAEPGLSGVEHIFFISEEGENNEQE